jgi:hypothetical protein
MPMASRYLQLVALALTLGAIGCQSGSDAPTSKASANDADRADARTLDFDALLKEVDAAIGKRFQSMQMAAMDSASYQYDGPIEPVIDIVRPVAEKAGFAEVTGACGGQMGPAESEMVGNMGMDMKSIAQRTWTHPNGDTLSVARMDVTSDKLSMKMLSVHLMNPKKMAELGAAAENPSGR